MQPQIAEMEVALRAGPIDKRVRVLGRRAWYDAVGHYALTPPAPPASATD